MNNSKMNYLKKFFNILYVIVLSIPLILLLVACVFPVKQVNNSFSIEETTTSDTETTIDFNQIVKNGKPLGDSEWSSYSSTQMNINNGVVSFTTDRAYTGVITNLGNLFINEHKYLFSLDIANNTGSDISMALFNSSYTLGGSFRVLDNTNFVNYSFIYTNTRDRSEYGYYIANVDQYINVSIKNIMVFDLTQMGLENITTLDFKKLFPLEYYSYNESQNITLSSLTITNTLGNDAQAPLLSNESKHPNYTIMYSLYDFYTLPLNSFYSSSMLDFLGISIDRDATFSYLVLYPIWLIWASMIKVFVDLFTMIPKLLRKLFKTEV